MASYVHAYEAMTPLPLDQCAWTEADKTTPASGHAR